MIIIFLFFMLSLTNVSASEDADIINMDYDINTYTINENTGISSSNAKSIEELDNEIQNSEPESTIKLENDYIISNETKISGIDIYSNITIDGQGHVIDGDSSNMDYLFRIHEDNVVLKNIKFTNLESIYSYNTIEWMGDNGKLVNCTFINNYAYNGGSIDWTGFEGEIINCTFINNTAENGGAIYYYGNYGTITNSKFINNYASEGGAICISGRGLRINKCSFDNNTADDGGAIYWENSQGNLTDSTFTNNNAENGGAIYTSSFKSSITSCEFYNNSADEIAGAIYWSANGGDISYCTFKDNTASIAGAIYGDVNDEIRINNSAFINNSAKEIGGALLIEDEGFIENSDFINNTAKIGGAIYSDFESHVLTSKFIRNSAESGGAIAMMDGEIINSTFTSNSASVSGGAIMCAGELTINGSTFNKNSAQDGTDNIVLMDDADVTIGKVTSDSQLIYKIIDMDISYENMTYGRSLKINVNLNQNLSEGKLYILLNGKLYSFNVTNGIANATISNLKTGANNFKIYYKCSDYSTQVEQGTVNVLKKKGTIIGTISFIATNFKKLSVALKDGYGRVLVGKIILNFVKGLIGTENVKVTSEGDNYSPSSKAGEETSDSAQNEIYSKEDSDDSQAIQEIKTAKTGLKQTSDNILKASDSSNLQDIINAASEGSSIKLSKSYTPQQHVKIEKTITIDGAGNTIDCSKAKIQLSSGQITLKNLIFENGDDYTLFIIGSAKCTIINCTFRNCKDNAITNNALNTLTVLNSKFIDNKAVNLGAAIYSKGMLVAENSTFINNAANHEEVQFIPMIL